MSTPVKVKKWGSSMAVLIPSQFAKMRNINVGSVLDLEPVEIVKPKRRRYTAKQLMAKFKPAHRHGEWNPAKPAGREIW
jgi:antitoxin component of MazEF toxin-antitoxin module